MFDVQLLVDIAKAAVSILVAILAVYLAFRLLGKLAKFFVMIAVLVFLAWLFFSDNSFLGEVLSLARLGVGGF